MVDLKVMAQSKNKEVRQTVIYNHEKKRLHIFSHLTTISFHLEWSGTWLLSPKGEYTSFLIFCWTT